MKYASCEDTDGKETARRNEFLEAPGNKIAFWGIFISNEYLET